MSTLLLLALIAIAIGDLCLGASTREELREMHRALDAARAKPEDEAPPVRRYLDGSRGS